MFLIESIRSFSPKSRNWFWWRMKVVLSVILLLFVTDFVWLAGLQFEFQFGFCSELDEFVMRVPAIVWDMWRWLIICAREIFVCFVVGYLSSKRNCCVWPNEWRIRKLHQHDQGDSDKIPGPFWPYLCKFHFDQILIGSFEIVWILVFIPNRV